MPDNKYDIKKMEKITNKAIELILSRIPNIPKEHTAEVGFHHFQNGNGYYVSISFDECVDEMCINNIDDPPGTNKTWLRYITKTLTFYIEE